MIKGDVRVVLRGLARHVRDYGWWPSRLELSEALRADHGAVVDYIVLLADRGFVERGARGYMLTGKGWKALGFKPIEPWSKRPVGEISKLTRKVSLSMQRLLREEGRIT